MKNLYEASNLDAAIQQAMAAIGSAMDVSRVYVFENEPDPNYCSNTYEWCGPDVSPQIDLLQHLSYTEDIDNYAEKLSTLGHLLLSGRDHHGARFGGAAHPPGDQVHVALRHRDHGVFRGFVGFDECRLNHLWTQEQVDTLGHLLPRFWGCLSGAGPAGLDRSTDVNERWKKRQAPDGACLLRYTKGY